MRNSELQFQPFLTLNSFLKISPPTDDLCTKIFLLYVLLRMFIRAFTILLIQSVINDLYLKGEVMIRSVTMAVNVMHGISKCS